jgi:hypothetical protein
MELSGKTVLISGASAGIGRALARDFARAGARLILTARSVERLQELSEGLAPAEMELLVADLARPDEVEKLCAELRRRYDRLDVLVNNAGAGLYGPSYESDPARVAELFQLNVLAPVGLVRGLSEIIPRGGAVVNISSIAGKVPLPWMNLYSASKYALNAYTDSLRMEFEDRGIHVMSVCPGHVSTGFSKHALSGALPRKAAGERRFGITAEQCSAAVLDGLRRGKRTVVTPKIGWLLIFVARVAPRLLHRKLAAVARPA